MQAKHKRTLKSGAAYEKYFRQQDLERKDPILVKHGDVFDTISQMEIIVKKTLSDTAEIAKALQGATLNQTCSNIFDFLYQHVQYTLDKPGIEQLRRPLRSWADRVAGVDCDCYSIFISSILMNLGIKHAFRMTKYGGDYQHIYVIVPKEATVLKNKGYNTKHYYTIDPVVDTYNYEVPFSSNHDKIMNPIQFLNGVSNVENPVLPGFGAEFIGFGESTLSGLGAAPQTAEQLAQDLLSRMKLHLVNTRNLLQPNPSVMPDGHTFLKQLNAVLEVWDDATRRDQLLQFFSAQEQAGLTGLGTLGGFFDNVWSGIKSGVKAVGTGIKNASDWVGEKAEQSWDKAKEVGQKVIDAVVKYNPLSIAMRNGLLLALKINLFKMSERLGYGYLTEAQAKAAGLNVTEWRKVKDKLDKVVNMHKGLQGDLDSLRKNIVTGWEKGTGKRFPGNLSGTGLGLVATTTSTAAASGLIATIVAWLKDVNWTDLFAKAQSFLAPKSTEYAGEVPSGYQFPDEQQYLQNQDKYDNPQDDSGSDNNNMLLMLGVVGVGAYLLMNQNDEK